MKAELEKLYEHIDNIEIAMTTTRRPDGHLQSRGMATQKRADGANLWFVTAACEEGRLPLTSRISTCRTC
jgi:general stress protein 26